MIQKNKLNQQNLKHEIIVLKFGHSILGHKNDIPKLVSEAYLYLRNGFRVLVVVSAIGKNTDQLKKLSQQVYIEQQDEPQKEAYATLLSTGEISSAALTVIGFNQAGIPAYKLNHSYLVTDSNILDANPLALDTTSILNLFDEYSVLVLPGFIGCDVAQKTTLLGRGGSDLTAIFCAKQLNAKNCILYKDSGGIIHNIDAPQSQQTLYKQISYTDCLNIPYPVIQHKALQYAKIHNVEILIKGINTPTTTIINNQTLQGVVPKQTVKKHRVLLLGLGTVGLGTFYNLLRNSELFEIVGVGVRDLNKYNALNSNLISTNLTDLLNRDYDILVELIGGTQSEPLITHALRNKKAVVTANKLLIATKWNNLVEVAKQNAVTLKYSAAVAGAIPILEVLENLAKDQPCQIVNSVYGIINGTCNFLLEQITTGLEFEAAVKLAQKLGYAEADPSFDIDGLDAAHKITIISRVAFGREPDYIEVEGINNAGERIKQATKRGNVVKLIASVTINNNVVTAQVKLTELSKHDLLAKVTEANNCLVVNVKNSQTPIVLHGKGAGRIPTALAVYSDLLDIATQTI
jgi:homoserine dehydrogenase